jgi:hypothetical protein
VRRLIDEDSAEGSPNRFLADLVRATSPIEPDALQKQRMLIQVRYTRRGARARLRPSVAVVLLASGSAAAAMVGRMASTSSWFQGSPSTERAYDAPSSPPLALAAQSGPDVVHDDVPEMIAPPAQALRSAPKRPRSPLPRPETVANAVASAPPRAAPAPSAVVSDSEDAAQVVQAIGELRNHGDASKASALLADYLLAHPAGVLAEDALALSIEAAAARHDPSAAADYGRRYLRQFPNGRYRPVAVRASTMGEP